MKILNLIFPKKKSAQLAKERLKIIISHENAAINVKDDFLPKLRQELVDVISKYVKLDADQIKINMHRQDNQSMIEMNVVMPDLSTLEPQMEDTTEKEKTKATETVAETVD